jgi:hypothetical protein
MIIGNNLFPPSFVDFSFFDDDGEEAVVDSEA